jgi:hypothetical protein
VTIEVNRLTNMVDAAGTTKYTYTVGNQLLTEDGPWASDILTTTYTHRLRTRLDLQRATGVRANAFGYDRLVRSSDETYKSYRRQFVYDGLGRLRRRIESSWDSLYGMWVVSSTVHYIYDGCRVIQERTGSNTPTVSYTRGTDLSGSLEGAGGIGGLLARSHGYSGSTGTWSTHNFYHADGNGNITRMINSGQSTVASYRYDPFGRMISQSGTLAGANVYRFSSKEFHSPSGLYYYGYRFYDPNLQLALRHL